MSALEDPTPGTLFLLAGLLLVGLFLARALHLTHLIPNQSKTPVRLNVWETAGAFFAALLVGPAIATIGRALMPLGKTGSLYALIGTQLGVLIVYLLLIGKSPKRLMLGRLPRHVGPILREACAGAITWALSLPLVLLTSMLLGALVTLLWGVSPTEQTVVQELRKTTQTPAEFFAYAMVIVIFIPTLEELIFRGLIHSWLRQTFSNRSTILFSATLFAGVHFSSQLGVSNIQVLGSLWVLGICLGILFERTHSLIGSITLHALFNLGTVMVIFGNTAV